MGDAVLIPMATLNINKTRRMGWSGYVDTVESVFEMYRENLRLGLVPEMVVESARPLVKGCALISQTTDGKNSGTQIMHAF